MAKKNYNIKIKETTKQKEETERFDYQEDAINNLKLLDDKFPNYYSTLIVVPTGGGKTRIAVEYLYRNVLNKKGHKVLWIAERLLLLEQAYDTFADLADREHLQGKEESHLITRLISSKHGNYGDTSFHDGIDLVIMTQQTLEKNIDRDSKIVKAMEKWLTEDDCLTIIIDEAHHAIAKPYRAILLSLLKLRKERKFKECHVIGLTATPKREENDEIEEIFSFGVMNNKENECIATSETSYGYQISIHDLVSKEILAIPYMAQIGGYEDKDEAIVSVYKEGASKLHFYDGQTGEDETAEIKEKFDSFGQSILFADSRIHALKLKKMFESMKIKCGLAISIDKKFENDFYEKAGEGTLEEYLGKNISEIKQQIKKDRQDYKDGNLPLIITVELLKEGVDIPKTQTVFIAKDKIDDVDVTQMVGRALRGRFQKGTPTAFIVSFGIGKLEKMLWETPESYYKNREGKQLKGDIELSELPENVLIAPKALTEEDFLEGEINQEEKEWLLQFEKNTEVGEELNETAVKENMLIRNMILNKTALLPQGYYKIGKRFLLVWEGMKTWIEEIRENIDSFDVHIDCLRTRSEFHHKAKDILEEFSLPSDEKQGFLPKDFKEIYLFYFMRFYMTNCGECKDTFKKEAEYKEFTYLKQYDVSEILVRSIEKAPNEFDGFLTEMWNEDKENLSNAWHDEEIFKCFLKPKLQRFHGIKIEPPAEDEEDSEDYFRVRIYREGRKRPALCEMLKLIVGRTAETCSCFADVFGGTGTVTAQMKEMFSKRIYNDYDVNLANFIYCVSDETLGRDFPKFCYDRLGDLIKADIKVLLRESRYTIEKISRDNGINDKDILKSLNIENIEQQISAKRENLTKNAEEKKGRKLKEYNKIVEESSLEGEKIREMRNYLLGRYEQLTKEKKMLEDSGVIEQVEQYLAFYYVTNAETDKLADDEKIRHSLNSQKISDYEAIKNRAFRFLFSRGFASNKVSGESITGIDSTGIRKFKHHLDWKGKNSWLTEFHGRMQGVKTQCMDFMEILKDYETEETVFYLDPPYFLTCQYQAGFIDVFHLEMLEWLRSTKCKWVLSCKDKGTNRLEAVNWRDRIGKEDKGKIIYVKDLRTDTELPKLDEYFKGLLYPMIPMDEKDTDAYWEKEGIKKKPNTTIYKADTMDSPKRQDKLFVYSLLNEKYGEIMISNIEVEEADRKILKDRGILMEKFEDHFQQIF